MSENGHSENGHSETLPVPGRDATVTFRRYATWADERDLARWARGREPEEEREERSWAFRAWRTLRMVESWTLADRAGKVLPLTAETLDALPRKVAGWIDDEAQRRFDGRPGDEEGPFDMPSPQPSVGTT